MRLRVSRAVRDKIWQKHEVRLYEVLEAISDPRLILRIERDETDGRIYVAVGKTEAGRLLRVVYIRKKNGDWLMTALDAYSRDRKLYTRK